MSVTHKPAAAWSRDSLAAWQWMVDSTEPKIGIGTSPRLTWIRFLSRWAVKILCLVNDEMGYSDWYWFLSRHFERELTRLDPHEGADFKNLMFTRGEYEPDPVHPEQSPIASSGPGPVKQ